MDLKNDGWAGEDGVPWLALMTVDTLGGEALDFTAGTVLRSTMLALVSSVKI